MSDYGSRSPSPPATPSRRRMKACAKRCERACCAVATFFPLAFVYSLTTWAVWVDAGIGFSKNRPDEELTYSRKIPSSIGILLYLLLNASYTTAVFVKPGSPTKSDASQAKGRYSVLPTTEPTSNDGDEFRSITVSSTGSSRYCKKCHVQKPDRAHHCSTCKRCVLKMDHHCPWLATCLGLHNYKAFILFLVYTSLFCWACFGNSIVWTWSEIIEQSPNIEDFAPVNVIMLAVLSGIIGLVITGFTSWHLYLCVRGLTTIECLEKTRYLSGVRKVVEQNRQDRLSHSRNPSDGLANNLKRARDQFIEFHANAVPGASRYEEGEEHVSPAPSVDHSNSHRTNYYQQAEPSPVAMPSARETPAQQSLRATYHDYEQSRETARYEAYVDEKETSSLPNAFDLGWRKNLTHLFGTNPLLWALPICNTTGDGRRWEVSQKWVEAHEELSRRREERLRDAANNPSHHQLQQGQYQGGGLRGGGGGGGGDYMGAGRHYYDEDHGHDHQQYDSPRQYADSAMSMQTLKRHRSGQKMRRDFDTAGEDGEVASFQVSGSEDDDNDSECGSESDDQDTEFNDESTRAGDRDGDRDRDPWGSRW